MGKRLLFIFMAVVVASIITFFGGELCVRVLTKQDLPTPKKLQEQSLRYAPSIFSRHVFPQKELEATGMRGTKYYINEKGYRGRNFPQKKEKGVKRVIFYGGSQAFDMLSNKDEDWPHRAERRLKEQGFSNIEIINAGTPGHASFDSLGRLLAEGHIFEPDYVVFCHAWNDIKYFRKDKPILRSFKPFRKEDDPRVSYKSWLDQFLSGKSQLYIFLRSAYYKTQIGVEGKKERKLISSFGDLGPKQFRLNIETFIDLARNIDAEPILMIQPRLYSQGMPKDLQKLVRLRGQGLTFDTLSQAADIADKIVYSVSKEKEVFLIDPSQAMNGIKGYFRDHIHLEEDGAQKLTEIVAENLIELFKKEDLQKQISKN